MCGDVVPHTWAIPWVRPRMKERLRNTEPFFHCPPLAAWSSSSLMVSEPQRRSLSAAVKWAIPSGETSPIMPVRKITTRHPGCTGLEA